MLALDLGRLERAGRVRLERVVPASDPLWEGAELRWRRPLQVELEAQKAGHDVLVRGQMRGEFELECRRCLAPVVVGIDEPVSMLFGPAVLGESDADEIYPLPARAQELDLSGPIREAVLLAAPRFALCREDCNGLCPTCGTNLNEAGCDCTAETSDERWAGLRNLKFE